MVETEKRVFLVDSENRIWGTRTPRTPRKLKKRLKKFGLYKPPHMIGFDIGWFNEDLENDKIYVRDII